MVVTSRRLVSVLGLLGACTACDVGAGEDGGQRDDLCGIEPGDEAPWFEVANAGTAVSSGGELRLSCGGQGSFMFELDPAMGGFVPKGVTVAFEAKLTVEDFNIGPSGSFAVATEAIWVGCCDYDYCYQNERIELFPPDTIADLTALDGQPGVLEISMTHPDGVVTQTFDVTILAVDDGSWGFCSGDYYYSEATPEVDASSTLPIPMGELRLTL